MARGYKKTGGRDFKVGNPGGPGRPKLPVEVREARELNRATFLALLNKYIHCSPKELKAVVNNKNAPAIDVIVCRVIEVSASEYGSNMTRLEFLLNRMLGKVPDSVEIESKTHTKFSIEDEAKVASVVKKIIEDV